MNDERREAWRRTRARGWLHFVVFRGLLAWGLPMLAIMLLINQPFSEGILSTVAVVYYITCPVGGLLFGAFLWFYAEACYKQSGQRI